MLMTDAQLFETLKNLAGAFGYCVVQSDEDLEAQDENGICFFDYLGLFAEQRHRKPEAIGLFSRKRQLIWIRKGVSLRERVKVLGHELWGTCLKKNFISEPTDSRAKSFVTVFLKRFFVC